MSPPVRASIVIAAYNAEGYIGAAVASALAQTLSDIEVLLVDDGSRDGTVEAALAAAADDPRLRVLRNDENRGVSYARNAALAVACGTWIAPLDADDTFTAERLARLVPMAEAAGADLLADNIMLAGAGGRPVAAFRHGERDPRRPVSLERFLSLDSPGSEDLPVGFMKPIMRRAFLEQHALRYPEQISAGEDFHLYVRALLRGARLFALSDGWYAASVRADSLSRANPERNAASLALSIAMLRRDAESLGRHRISRALAARADELVCHPEYSLFVDALRARNLAEALRRLPVIASRRYTWRRLRDAAARRIFRRRRGALVTLGGS